MSDMAIFRQLTLRSVVTAVRWDSFVFADHSSGTLVILRVWTRHKAAHDAIGVGERTGE